MRSLGFVTVCVLALASFGAAPAQHLPRSTVTIDTAKGPVRFAVEIAGDAASRMQGLMYRKYLEPNAGMLFDFHGNHPQAFWMKNTILPLDMIFIRSDGTISSIASHTVPYSEQPVISKEPVRGVLEINAGRSDALGITPGETVHSSIFKNASRN
jgi:uncharacterized protein